MVFFCACNKMKVYDRPCVYVVQEGDAAYSESSTVSAMSNNLVKTYNIVLSAEAMAETVNVVYDIVVGDGLKEGVDFELHRQPGNVTFLPGIHFQPVRITFKRSPVDETKDNSLTIRIVSTPEGTGIGMEGPSHRNSIHKILKIN